MTTPAKSVFSPLTSRPVLFIYLLVQFCPRKALESQTEYEEAFEQEDKSRSECLAAAEAHKTPSQLSAPCMLPLYCFMSLMPRDISDCTEFFFYEANVSTDWNVLEMFNVK